MIDHDCLMTSLMHGDIIRYADAMDEADKEWLLQTANVNWASLPKRSREYVSKLAEAKVAMASGNIFAALPAEDAARLGAQFLAPDTTR